MQSLQKQAPYWKAPIGQLGLVELDAVDAGVDLDPDDRLEVLPPHRVVAVHVEALVLAVRALDPAGVAGLLVDVAATHSSMRSVTRSPSLLTQPVGEVRTRTAARGSGSGPGRTRGAPSSRACPTPRSSLSARTSSSASSSSTGNSQPWASKTMPMTGMSCLWHSAMNSLSLTKP